MSKHPDHCWNCCQPKSECTCTRDKVVKAVKRIQQIKKQRKAGK